MSDHECCMSFAEASDDKIRAAAQEFRRMADVPEPKCCDKEERPCPYCKLPTDHPLGVGYVCSFCIKERNLPTMDTA